MTDAATMIFIVKRARKLRHPTEPYIGEQADVAAAWVKRALNLCWSKGWYEAGSTISRIWHWRM